MLLQTWTDLGAPRRTPDISRGELKKHDIAVRVVKRDCRYCIQPIRSRNRFSGTYIEGRPISIEELAEEYPDCDVGW